MSRSTVEPQDEGEVVDLDLGCLQCGARLTVLFENWVHDREHLLKSGYECPFCRKTFPIEAVGRVAWASPSVDHRLSTH